MVKGGNNVRYIYIIFGLLLLSLGLLTACSGIGEPQLIAVHPDEGAIAIYPKEPPPSPDLLVVYSASLEMEVSNVDRAADQATSLAYEYGGYLANSQSWYQDKDKHTTLVLAVPVSRFEAVRRDLLSLGRLVSERVSGELAPYGGDAWRTFSHITVHLSPRPLRLPSLNMPDWRPARTFAKAWEVFISIFGFLTDIVIWLVVVIGPFVLAAWVLRAFLQRRQKKADVGDSDEEITG
jgi:hypothetical protein